MRGISKPWIVTALAIVIVGCAHGRPPAAPTRPTSPGANSPSTPEPDTRTSEKAPSTPTLDPSEQITAEELATIPDPVPGATEPAPTSTEAAPVVAPPIGTGSVDPGSAIWRVQVFASPDRAQAERAAREASSRLGEDYVIDHESGLYKVRLGEFTTEAAAEPLKRKAVLEGYTGAFRVKIATDK